MGKLILILMALLPLYKTSCAQQPRYTKKHFVVNLDTNEFKITMPKTEGTGYTFLKISPPLMDVDDLNSTAVKFSQEVVVKIVGKIQKGKRNGIFETFLIDSFNHNKLYKIWDQEYRNDKLNGQWKIYNLAGTLIHYETYADDKKTGFERSYWIDGKTIMTETEFFTDTTKTIKREYFPSGKIRSEISLLNGIPDGPSKKYYENGNTEDEVVFSNGMLNGVRIYYYPDGKKWIEEEYKNDKHWTLIANYNSKGDKRNGGTLKNGNGTLIFYEDDYTIRETVLFVNGVVKK
jgi:antitoxin component YwqK of YwqJK toxin-antitoxin module